MGGFIVVVGWWDVRKAFGPRQKGRRVEGGQGYRVYCGLLTCAFLLHAA